MTLDDVLKLTKTKVINCPCGSKITVVCTVFADERTVNGIGTNLRVDANLDHFGCVGCTQCSRPHSIKRFRDAFHKNATTLAKTCYNQDH